MLDADQKYFFFYRHQHKGDTLLNALQEHGWKRTRDMHLSRACFMDLDVDNRVPLIDTLTNLGQKIFIYPHGARPNVAYMWKKMRPHPRTTAYIVPTVGHAELMREMDVKTPMIITGWWLTGQKPFKPYKGGTPHNVLFAPLHPNGNGWLCDLDKSINLLAYERLLKARERLKFRLTIRYIHSLKENGLPPHRKDIKYSIGDTNGNEVDDIDRTDVVVTHQTFGYKSVARGVPTLFMSEWHSPRAGNTPETFAHIDQDYWLRTKHRYMFPFDINAEGDPAQHLLDAGHPSAEDIIYDWRERFIGPKFDGKHFSDEIERYCEM